MEKTRLSSKHGAIAIVTHLLKAFLVVWLLSWIWLIVVGSMFIDRMGYLTQFDNLVVFLLVVVTVLLVSLITTWLYYLIRKNYLKHKGRKIYQKCIRYKRFGPLKHGFNEDFGYTLGELIKEDKRHQALICFRYYYIYKDPFS